MSLATLIAPALVAFSAFRSGEIWRDTAGAPIDAHGGGFLLDGGTYYWYGSARNGLDPPCCKDRGINLYTSKDLYNWRHEGLVLAAFNGSSPSRNGLDLERPKNRRALFGLCNTLKRDTHFFQITIFSSHSG